MRNRILIAMLCIATLLTSCVDSKKTTQTDAPVQTSDSELKTEDETATESKKETSSTPVEKKLSDDLNSFQLQIEDDIYSFPMTYSEFTSYGWEYQEDDSEKLDPDTYFSTCVFKNKASELVAYADICNFQMNVEPISNCYVSSFNIDEYNYGDSSASILLPNGIEFGKSSLEDIKSAYGEPTDTYESNLYTKYTYRYDNYSYIELYVSTETNALSQIIIKNMQIPENLDTGKVNSEVPSVVKNYVTPTELGDDFSAFIVEYASDLYQLPAPVSEFVNNGWKIIEDHSDSSVAAKSTGYIELRKNNQSFRAMVENFADYATTLENCFVLEVKSSLNDTNIPLTLQKNITTGMSQTDLEKALKGTDIETEESEYYKHYFINCAEDKILDGIQISVYLESGKVETIELSNSALITE